MSYEDAWHNSWGPYTQCCRIEDVDKRLQRLLQLYGQAFNDEWWFYACNRGRGKNIIVKRVPIWQTNKRIDIEKSRVAAPTQTELLPLGRF